MRLLITGGHGFVGQHLCRELLSYGHEPLLLGHESSHSFLAPSFACDIRDQVGLEKILKETRPDGVIHLAGISHVMNAARDLSLLTDIHVVGTQRLLAAMAAALPQGTPILLASTANVYGNHETVERIVGRGTPIRPEGAYALSKLAAEYAARTFAPLLKVYIARPFNHIGPGQHPSFVCTAFAQKIKQSPAGSSITVGDLEAYRDFTDVRDMVRAYRLILEQKPREELFVLGSGEAVQIRHIFESLVALSGKEIKPMIDEALLRPREPVKTVADLPTIKADLGWQPLIPLEQTLRDIYQAAV